MVISYLDYANSLYSRLPSYQIQRIQNFAAKVVLSRRKSDSSTKSLKDLHWLPIKARIDFKILTLVYKCLNERAPQYLIDLLTLTEDSNTRSDNSYKKLKIPFATGKTFLDRSFSLQGPI